MSEYWQSGAYRLAWESKLGISWETKFKRSKALPGIGAEHLNQDPNRSYFLEEYNSLQTRESNLLFPCVWLQLIASLFCFSFLNKSFLLLKTKEKNKRNNLPCDMFFWIDGSIFNYFTSLLTRQYILYSMFVGVKTSPLNRSSLTMLISWKWNLRAICVERSVFRG